MNQIDRPAPLGRPTETASEPSSFSIESGLCRTEYDSSRCVFAPVHYEPRYAYPLLVWLHGPDADERQLMRIMPLVSMRNYVAVAPRGFLHPDAASEGRQDCWPQSPDHIDAAAERVFEAVETVQQRFTVHRQRVFLAGFDCGGTMAFRLAMNHPEKFAGVLSVGGRFPRMHHPLRQLNLARRIPIFLAVGRDSHLYSPEHACDDLRLFHTAGMSITLRQYPCAHQLAPQTLRDVDRWIIEQITPASQPAGK